MNTNHARPHLRRVSRKVATRQSATWRQRRAAVTVFTYTFFGTLLLLWGGLLVLFSTPRPSHPRAAGVVTSPHAAREAQAQRLRATAAHDRARGELQKELRRHPTHEGVAAVLLSKLPESGRHFNDPISILREWKPHPWERPQQEPERRRPKRAESARGFAREEAKRKPQRGERKPQSKEKPRRKTKSARRAATAEALISSAPRAQEERTNRHPAGAHAFAAEAYRDRSTAMGDDDDKLDYYYAVDDDAVRGDRREETYADREDFCRTPAFYRQSRPTCNDVHAAAGDAGWLAVAGGRGPRGRRGSRYLGGGGFRQVFLLARGFAAGGEEVVFKSMRRFHQDKQRKLEERAGKSL